MLNSRQNKCKRFKCQFVSADRMEHFAADTIFRFSRGSLYVRAGPFVVMPCEAAPKLTPDSTGALFWLDGVQMQTPRHPPGAYITSLTEPTWFPSGRLGVRVWTGGGGCDTWNPPVACGPGEGESMYLPQLSATFLPHLTCPSAHCLAVWLLVWRVRL